MIFGLYLFDVCNKILVCSQLLKPLDSELGYCFLLCMLAVLVAWLYLRLITLRLAYCFLQAAQHKRTNPLASITQVCWSKLYGRTTIDIQQKVQKWQVEAVRHAAGISCACSFIFLQVSLRAVFVYFGFYTLQKGQ